MDIVRAGRSVQFDHRSNRADFSFDWTAKDDDGNPVDLTGAVIACAISDRDGIVLQVRSDDDNDVITIDGSVLSFLFPQSLVGGFNGSYGIGCTSLQGTATTQLFVGSVAFYDGVATV